MLIFQGVHRFTTCFSMLQAWAWHGIVYGMKAWRLWPKPCLFAAANAFGGEALLKPRMVNVDGDWLVRWNEKTHNLYIYILWCMYVYIFYIHTYSFTGYTYNYQCSMIYVYRCMMLNDSYSDIIWTGFEWHDICCCFKHPWMIVLERTVGVMLQPIHWSDQAWGVWIWEFHTEHWLNWI